MGIIKTVYNSFFGKSYEAVWRQFAQKNNGIFSEKDDTVEIVYKEHKILFDVYTNYSVVGNSSVDREYTRVRLEFVSPDNLKLRLIPQGFIDTIGKLFGAQDIIIGDKEFDKRFVIKGNEEFKIQMLFSNEIIRSILLSQKDLYMEIMEEYGIFDEKIKEGYSMAIYISQEKITDAKQLNSLLQLYTNLIDQLIKSNSLKV